MPFDDALICSRRAASRRACAGRKSGHCWRPPYKAADPEIGALTPSDIRESRIVVCDPAPIPLEEMQRTYDWLKSWGMLEDTASPLELVNIEVQSHGHIAAE